MKNHFKRKIAIMLSMFLLISGIDVNVSMSSAAIKSQNSPKIATGNFSMKSTNDVGRLIEKAVTEKEDEKDSNNGNNIFSVEMLDKVAMVSMETVRDCTLVVGIYEEDGIKMLATGNRVIMREEREVEVNIEIDAMPQYYIVRAFLVETDTLDPLCSVYETPMYTKEMQDFLSKTTDDFEEERVLNLDEDKTNNFAVYDGDTKIIREGDDSNHLECTDEEKQIYVIENADASVTSLSKGDTFAYEHENKEVVIVKVQSVSTTGSTVTINGEDTELEDVFEYVKIDETTTTEDMEVDASTCSEEIEYQGKENNATGRKGAISGEESKTVSLSYKFVGKESTPAPTDSKPTPTSPAHVKFNLSGEVKLSINTTLKVYLSRQYQYLEFTSKYSLVNDWKGEVKGAANLKLGKILIKPIPILNITFTPFFLLEAKASVGVTGTIEGCIGYSVSPQDGFKNLTSGPSYDKTELKLEGSVFMGLSLEPSITVVTSKLVEGDAKGKAGLELTLSKDYLETLDDAKEKHDCSNCFEGEVHVKVEVSASFKFLDNESLSASGKKGQKYKISDVYVCLGHGKFGFSACPYHQYKITVIAKNPDGTLVKDATVDHDFRTNSKGEAYLWLAQGKHKLSVSKNGKDQVTKVIDVAGKARKITVTFKTNSKVEDGTDDVEDDNGNVELEENPLAGKKIKSISSNGDVATAIDENGNLYMWEDGSPIRVIMKNVKKVFLSSKVNDAYAAITENGDLYMWGSTCNFQIGDGKEYDTIVTPYVNTPVKILSNVKSVYFVYCGCSAITENEDLYCWGIRGVGDGTDEPRYTPVKVLSNVRQVVAEGIAVTNDDSVYMWGRYSGDILGDKKDNLTPTKKLSNVKQMYCDDIGPNYAMLKDNGDLYTWGHETALLGDGSNEGRSYLPVRVLGGIKKIIDICTVISDENKLYKWGTNHYGEIGNGTTKDQFTAIQINGLSDISDANTVYTNSSAITGNGDLYMWGENGVGQIGNGTTQNQLTPQKILTNVKQAELCGNYSMALTKDGKLYMWGKYSYAQFGGSEGHEVKKTPFQINAPLPTSKKVARSTKKRKFSSFENLEKNTTYSYYILKSRDTDNVLSGDNLLYIGQSVTDSSGTLCPAYEMKEDCEEPIIILKKLGKEDISNAKITISNLKYNKQEQYINPVVTYQKKTLVEGEDYELSGDFSANGIGTYTVTICGIGDFTGLVDKTYDVYCSHQFGDWIITKQPTANSTGTKKKICSVCKYEETAIISKLQSASVPKDIEKKPAGSKTKKKTTVKKPSKVSGLAIKNKGKNKMVISWSWKVNVSGFQIQYAQNKSFTKKKKSKSVGRWTSRKTISKLKIGKTYYVRVRAFKKSSGRKIYGKWSKIKGIKIKK